MLKSRSNADFVSVPIQVEAGGPPGEWAPGAEGDGSRPSLYGDGRDSLFEDPKRTRWHSKIDKKVIMTIQKHCLS